MGISLVNQPDWSLDAEFRPNPVSPLGFGPFGERPPIPANDQGSSLARAVSEDLEEIFAPLPADAPEEPRRSPRVRTLGAPDAPARVSRLAGLGAVAAALLAGVVLGSILLKPHPKPVPMASAPAAAPHLGMVPSAADLPAPPPVAAEAAPRTTAAPAIRPKPAAHRAATSRAAVLAADRRLRRAYATAARAGVSRGVLVAARNRWAATRNAQPGRLVATYGALAGDLERRAAHGRRAHGGRG